MPAMQDVAITPLPIDWLGAVTGPDRLTGVRRSLTRLRRVLGDRTVWTVNSTATGCAICYRAGTSPSGSFRCSPPGVGSEDRLPTGPAFGPEGDSVGRPAL
jgi:hypothetical protein